jgi:phenylalanyl-tRNA synthetase beta chain
VRIGLDVLRRWVDLPGDAHEVRQLLDSCGLEVKRVEPDEGAVTFTLELLANRGDHHCYDGVAVELRGRTGAAVRRPTHAALQVGPPPWPVRVEDDRCLVYTATLLERTERTEGALDEDARRVLVAAGLNPVSAPVDATNVANLELGQPTHAFDADRIEGPITVRASRRGERAWLLFQEEPVEVPEGTLVIADDAKILAIAGVIGCEESKTTSATRRLLLESAAFDPVAVRLASRALKVSTDSSARFERGSDPERPLLGAGRVAALLEGAGWRRVGASGVAGSWRNPGRVVSIDADAVSAHLAVRLSPEEVAERLRRYGFGVSGDAERTPSEDSPGDHPGEGRLHVSVPSWRLWDVEFPADLYEEVAKSIGYDETPEILPPVATGALPSPAETRRSRAEEVLLGYGFYECITDGFYGRSALQQLGIDEGHPLFAHVETTNAVDRAYSLLKNNALHQALEAVAFNERHQTRDVKLFEWTRTFHPLAGVGSARSDRSHPPCSERRLLWLVASGRDRPRAWDDTGRPADAWFLKGVVRELAVELGLDLELVVSPSDRSDQAIREGAPPQAFREEAHPLQRLLHPGRSALLVSMGEVVGILGEVHPAVCRRYKLKAIRPCYLELDESAILAEGMAPAYTEPPSVQPLVRSVTFALPRGLDAGDVSAWIHANAPDWLQQVAIVDLFVPTEGPGTAPRPEQLSGAGAGPTGVRNVTFDLHYAPRDEAVTEGGRTADEVNTATEDVIRAVVEQFGPRGVQQR